MLSVTVKGIEPAVKRLTLYSERIAEWETLWTFIAEQLAKAEEELFTTEGKGGWEGLTAAYAMRKAALYPGKPILEATGDLKDSLTNIGRALRLNGPSVMRFGSDVAYSIWHHTGTSKMPKRDPIVPMAEVRAAVREGLIAHLQYR